MVKQQDPQLKVQTVERSPGPATSEGNLLSMRQFWAEVLALTFLSILVPLVIYLDAVILFDHISEATLTELMQAILIISTAALFFYGARKIPQAKGYLMSVATLCCCMFLRENDVYFDVVWQGFWLVPVSVVLFFGVTFAIRHRQTLRQSFLRHATTREGGYLMVGFVVVLVFSRVYGSGDLWRAIMGPDYAWQFKSALQEGIELMGYSLITFGAVLSFLSGFGQGAEPKKQ